MEPIISITFNNNNNFSINNYTTDELINNLRGNKFFKRPNTYNELVEQINRNFTKVLEANLCIIGLKPNGEIIKVTSEKYNEIKDIISIYFSYLEIEENPNFKHWISHQIDFQPKFDFFKDLFNKKTNKMPYMENNYPIHRTISQNISGYPSEFNDQLKKLGTLKSNTKINFSSSIKSLNKFMEDIREKANSVLKQNSKGVEYIGEEVQNMNVTHQVVPKNQQNLQPEIKHTPEPEPIEAVSDYESESEPNPEPIPNPNPEPIPKPNPEPIPKPNPEPIPKPNPEPNPKPNPEAIPKPNPEPNPKPNPEPNPKPNPEPNPKPNPEPNPKPNPEPNPNPNPEPPDDKELVEDIIKRVDEETNITGIKTEEEIVKMIRKLNYDYDKVLEWAMEW